MKDLKFCSVLVLFWLCLASPAAAQKIGFYFGTFDPPHRGHLAVVQAAKTELDLDSVYVLPNYEPSHKPGASSFRHRYQMVQMIAMRQPEIKLLPESDFKQAYETNPTDYIGLIIQALQKKEGPDNQYFHLTGVDSFNKMVAYGKLPAPAENRIVAVLPREGYQIKRVPEVIEAEQRGQVLFLTRQIQGMSSSYLRESVRTGEWQNLQGNLPDYVLAYILREGLFGRNTHQLDLHALSNPPGYLAEKINPLKINALNKEMYSQSDFKAYALHDFIELDRLADPLTLNQDEYLKEKMPESIYELLTTTNTRIKLVGGITETLESRAILEQWIRQSGSYELVDYWKPDRERIGLHYWLAYDHEMNQKEPIPYLIISNFFGEDRLYHVLLQYARVLQGAGRSLEQLELYLPDHFSKLEMGLCQSALKDLRVNSESTVFIGYHGALNYVLSDLKQYQQKLGLQRIKALDLDYLDDFIKQKSRYVSYSESKGMPYYPYWTYSLETLHGSHQIVSFRNTYGMATETLLKTLIHKGFRSFVLFGNGGALSQDIELNQIYAPTRFSFSDEEYSVRNRARLDYPEASLVKVRSILDESWPWLHKNKLNDLVDVENFDAARALNAVKGLDFYSGILVSDRPGVQDITHKDEDSQALIQRKREFFFNLLKEIMTRDISFGSTESKLKFWSVDHWLSVTQKAS